MTEHYIYWYLNQHGKLRHTDNAPNGKPYVLETMTRKTEQTTEHVLLLCSHYHAGETRSLTAYHGQDRSQKLPRIIQQLLS